MTTDFNTDFKAVEDNNVFHLFILFVCGSMYISMCDCVYVFVCVSAAVKQQS